MSSRLFTLKVHQSGLEIQDCVHKIVNRLRWTEQLNYARALQCDINPTAFSTGCHDSFSTEQEYPW